MSTARRGTAQRGDAVMWSWVLHRITGATIFFFLFAHVLNIAVVRISPQAFNQVVGIYQGPIVGLLNIGLVACVLYHALSGLRVILIDFWHQGPRYQQQLRWGVAAIWFIAMVPAAVVIGMHITENLR